MGIRPGWSSGMNRPECRPASHLLIPFGGEPIIFDTLLFVREACQVRRLEVSRPCLAESGLRVETHRFVFGWGLCDSRAPVGRIASFLWHRGRWHPALWGVL